MTKLIVEMTTDERDFLLMALRMVRHETEHPTVAKTLREAVIGDARKYPGPEITDEMVERAAASVREWGLPDVPPRLESMIAREALKAASGAQDLVSDPASTVLSDG